jgi:type IV/VI secretion system ImpK/VasF family protein
VPPPPAKAEATASLTELCEPLFQYVCMLNRIARNPGGESMAFEPLRKLIAEMFEQMEKEAEPDYRLKAQFAQVKMPLIFFVDSMIAESKLSLAPQWHKNRLAYDYSELAGDEKFFDLLDETLKQTGEETDERLAIFYTCLGLGFTGWYAGQPEYLRKKMLDVARRIPRELIDTQHNAKICPEAYQFLDTRNLVEPPGLKLATMGILFGGFLLIVMVVNLYLFRTASTGLSESLRTILSHDLTTPR